MGSHRARNWSAAALVVTIFVVLNGCVPPPDTYVALGDSYTAGPLIPNQSTSPLGCLRSDHNYAALLAPTLGLARFVDVSCSGGETEDMFNPQDVTPGPANPPQLDAVDARTKVVSVGIGGNDIGFSSIVTNCVNLNPFGTPCKNGYAKPGGGDTISDNIAATRPKVDAVLQAIHQRAPQAKVFLVGYPDILPETGTGCWPLVPILGPDVTYLRGKEKELNAMLAAAAAANTATFVDTYTGTIGHDVCSGGSKWIEGLVPTAFAAPVHPNGAGMAAIATIVGPPIKAAAGT